MEIDYDDKTMFTDRPVGEVGLEAINITEGIAKVGLSENLNLGQTDEIAQILNEICIGENPSETLLKKANSKEEIFKQSETVDIDVDNNCNNVDSRGKCKF